MIEYFLQRGGESVFWINPYPTRLPYWNELVRRPDPVRFSCESPDNLNVLDIPALPIEPLPAGAWFNRTFLWVRTLERISSYADTSAVMIGVGRPSALAIHVLRKVSAGWRFYDAMDDFPSFYRGLSGYSMARRERLLGGLVDTVIASSSCLYDKFLAAGCNVRKILNGYSMQSLPVPSLSRRREPTVLGYIGTIGQWFDWSLLVALAEAVPWAQIKVIGPCYQPCARQLPGNVMLLPPCSQTQAVDHLKTFSMGLIPFKRNALTQGVDPIKYYEYRAMGLPVLSTCFGEMALRREQAGVYFFEQSDSLESLVMEGLSHSDSESSVYRFRRENDWNRRFSGASLFEDALIRNH